MRGVNLPSSNKLLSARNQIKPEDLIIGKHLTSKEINQDLGNCRQIRDKKSIFRDYIDEARTRIMLIDMVEQKKTKLKEKEEDDLLEKKAKKLRAKIHGQYGQNTQEQEEEHIEEHASEKFLKDDVSVVPLSVDSHTNTDVKMLEMELWEVRQKIENKQQKKEKLLSQPTKIAQLQNVVDELVFDNIERLANPNSQGAKNAKYKQKNPELFKKVTEFSKSKLPAIKGRQKGSKVLLTDDQIEPLQHINVNYKTRDVGYIHFKSKNALSPQNFNSQIRNAVTGSFDERENRMRNKINQSIDTVAKIRVGGELPNNQFLEQTPKSNKNGASATSGGLPIFKNQPYLKNLRKLLSSEDLDECYDYDANDKSYRVLYECLTQKGLKTEFSRGSLSPTRTPFSPIRESQDEVEVDVQKFMTPRHSPLKMPSVQKIQHPGRVDDSTFMTQIGMINSNPVTNIGSQESLSPQKARIKNSKQKVRVGDIMMRRIQHRNQLDSQKFSVVDIHSNTLNDFKLNTTKTKVSKNTLNNFQTPRISEKYLKKQDKIRQINDSDLLKLNSSQQKLIINDEIENLNQSITKMTDLNGKPNASNKHLSSNADLEQQSYSSAVTQNLTYEELNTQLQFPNNPAYFQLKKASTSDTKEAQLARELKEQKKVQTLLEFCREQGIAFTDTDKVMYSLQKTKELHKIQAYFLENKVKMIDGESDDEINDKDEHKSSNEIVDFEAIGRKTASKFSGANLAFNECGEFNKHLDDQQMIKYFQQILDGKIAIPPKRPKKIVIDKDNQGLNDNQSDYSSISINKLNRTLGIDQQTSQMAQIDEDNSIDSQNDKRSKHLSKKESSFSTRSKGSKSRGVQGGGTKANLATMLKTTVKFKGLKQKASQRKSQNIEIQQVDEDSDYEDSFQKSSYERSQRGSSNNLQKQKTKVQFYSKKKSSVFMKKGSIQGSSSNILGQELAQKIKKSFVQRAPSLNLQLQDTSSSFNNLKNRNTSNSLNFTGMNRQQAKILGKMTQNMVTSYDHFKSNSNWQIYTARNQTFRDGLMQLQESIDEPAAREESMREVTMQEEVRKKKLKQEKSQEVEETNNSQGDQSDSGSEKARFEEKKRKTDPTYGMLDVCKRRIRVKHKLHKETNKLVERMELDRPILQREKFELIFLERINELNGSEEDQKLQQSQIANFVSEKIHGNNQKHANTPGPKKEIKSSEIRKAMGNRMKQRKQENKIQLQAYQKMCQYIKNRFWEEKIRPSKDDLMILEVLKKIVESGWIIAIPEIKQVMQFLYIQKENITGSHNQHYRIFLDKIFKEFNIKCDIMDTI